LIFLIFSNEVTLVILVLRSNFFVSSVDCNCVFDWLWINVFFWSLVNVNSKFSFFSDYTNSILFFPIINPWLSPVNTLIGLIWLKSLINIGQPILTLLFSLFWILFIVSLIYKDFNYSFNYPVCNLLFFPHENNSFLDDIAIQCFVPTAICLNFILSYSISLLLWLVVTYLLSPKLNTSIFIGSNAYFITNFWLFPKVIPNCKQSFWPHEYRLSSTPNPKEKNSPIQTFLNLYALLIGSGHFFPSISFVLSFQLLLPITPTWN